MTAIFRLTVLVAAALLAAPCPPAFAQPVAPEVSIANVTGIALQGSNAVLDLLLSVHNPGGLTLPLQALRFHIWLGGVDVARGQSTEPVTIPAQGQASVPVQLNVDSASMLGVLATAAADGTVPYKLEGHAEIGLSMLRIPFNRTGRVALRRG